METAMIQSQFPADDHAFYAFRRHAGLTRQQARRAVALAKSPGDLESNYAFRRHAGFASHALGRAVALARSPGDLESAANDIVKG